MKKSLALILVAACVLMTACARNRAKPPPAVNPPPVEAFAAFDRFDLKPVVLSPETCKYPVNLNAVAKIQEYFNERVKPAVDEWNARGKQGRTLVIEPVVEDVCFAPARNSSVAMKVRYVERASGKIIAHPEFHQQAPARRASSPYGLDHAMLARIVTLIAEYNERNHDAPVGGPTGMPVEE